MSTYCPMCDEQKTLPSGRNDCPDCGTILNKDQPSSPPQQPPADTPPGGAQDDESSDGGAADGQCPNCGEEVDDEFKACPYCMTPLDEKPAEPDPISEGVCPECGHDGIQPGMQICPMCTRQLSGTGGDDGGGVAHPADVDGSDGADDGGRVPPSSIRLQFDAGPVMTVDDGTSLGVEIRKKLNNAGVPRRQAMRVSRRHVMFKQSDDGFDVVDLESSNGTWLNGDRLDPNEEYPLSDGDSLEIADVGEATVRF